MFIRITDADALEGECAIEAGSRHCRQGEAIVDVAPVQLHLQEDGVAILGNMYSGQIFAVPVGAAERGEGDDGGLAGLLRFVV